MREFSFASEPSSSSSSPSAVSYSGGSTQSLGTMHGKATPMEAALFSQPGAGVPVSFWQICDVKWLQFLVRRL